MPSITLTIWDKTAATDTDEIVNGNSDYIVTVDADGVWSQYDAVRLRLIRYLADGTTPETEIEIGEGTASLPALHNTCAIGLGLVAISGDTTVQSDTVTILCTACITDGNTTLSAQAFDIYNAMMEYIAKKTSKTATAEELAELYQTIADHWASLPANPDYPASYRTAIASPCRYTKLEGTLTSTSGAKTHITTGMIAANSVVIAWDCTADGAVLPGGVPSAELQITLNNTYDCAEMYGAELELVFSIMLPGGWFGVPLGTYTVCDIADRSNQGVELTAYDDMYSLGIVPLSDLGIVLGRAYTPQEIITMCAAAVGIEYTEDVSGWTNGTRTFVLSSVDTNVANARDLLMYTMQIVCGFAYIDRNRKLRVVRLAMTAPTVTITENQRMSIAVTQQAYRLYRLDTSYEYPNSDGNREVKRAEFYTLWADGATATLRENPLFTVLDVEPLLREGYIRTALTSIVRQLDALTFTPIEAEQYGDPTLEPFEWRTFIRGSESYNAPVMRHTWRYSGIASVSSAGQEAVAGVVQDQAQKAALAKRISAAEQNDNFFRTLYKDLIKASGHAAMAAKTHAWLAHYTQGELSGEEG